MTTTNSEMRTIRFAVAGRRFPRTAVRYCDRNELAIAWKNNGGFPRRYSMSTVAVRGTDAQLKAFVEWADHQLGHGTIAADFRDETFMSNCLD
jgi:hypothetical protein